MTNFEKQLEAMIPVIRESQKQTHRHSVATTLFGFALGVLVTYCYMLPSDSPQRPIPQETFTLAFDESSLERLNRPADVFQCVVRVPIPKPIHESAPQYGAMMLRNDLLRL
jgi:hypothetical protein